MVFLMTIKSSLLIVFFIGSLSLAAERPNVLFIVCDDLNSHVSTSNYKPIKTPNLELLAASGMRFNRAYCQYE